MPNGVVRNCPSCGAPSRPGQLSCEYCGSFVAKEPRSLRRALLGSAREVLLDDFGFESPRALWVSLGGGLALSLLGAKLEDAGSWWSNDVAIFQWLGSIPLWYLVVGLLKNRQVRSSAFIPAVFVTSPLPFLVNVVLENGGVGDDLVGLSALIGSLAVVGYLVGILLHRYVCYKMTFTSLRKRGLSKRVRRMSAPYWIGAAAAYGLIAGGVSVAVWWATAPRPAAPATPTDHPYATHVRFEPRFDVRDQQQRNVGGVIENRGDRYIRTLNLALNVVGSEGEIRNTARRRLLPFGDVNIAPGERLAVLFQVFPGRSGRGEFVVEEIEVGLPASGPDELRQIEVVPTARAGVPSLWGSLEHQLRHERADASRGLLSLVFSVHNLTPHAIEKLTYSLSGDGVESTTIYAVRPHEYGGPTPALEPGETRTFVETGRLKREPGGGPTWRLELEELAVR